MVKVIWTNRALKDLENIAEYISKDSRHYAKLTLAKNIATESVLENNPKIGRLVPELNDQTIREFIKGFYRIIYQVNQSSQPNQADQTSEINILTVFHSSRLFSVDYIQ